MTDQLHLGVALDGYGWHRRAWRTTLSADPAAESVLSGRYWAGLAATAERGLLDFLTIDDTLTPQPGRREEISPRRLAGCGGAGLGAAPRAPGTPGWCRWPPSPPPSRFTSPRPSPHWTTFRTGGLVGSLGSAQPRMRRHCSVGATDRSLPTVCSTRPPMPSRWYAGCGTAGRTTR